MKPRTWYLQEFEWEGLKGWRLVFAESVVPVVTYTSSFWFKIKNNIDSRTNDKIKFISDGSNAINILSSKEVTKEQGMEELRNLFVLHNLL